MVRENGHVTYHSFAKKREAVDFAEDNGRSPVGRTGDLLAEADGLQSTKKGWVYAASITPLVNERHLKIGFTKDLRRRLSEMRTTSPTIALVAVWDGDPYDEKVVHAVLKGRIGKSEVFVVHSLVKALARIDREIGKRRL